VNAVVRK
jgi:hypothetical protein